jgi:hypothetical protein
MRSRGRWETLGFLAAGAQILKHPALLRSSQIEGQVTETVNNVVELAEFFRPVEEVRVSGTAIWPKIDLVLAGDALRLEEFKRFMTSVQFVPADVMILPNIPED